MPKPIFIIFDLDDTLVDTTGSTRPIKLRDAFNAMVKAGMDIPDLLKAYETLVQIDKKTSHSTETFHQFIAHFGLKEEYYSIATKEYFSNMSHIPINPLPGAIESLSTLKDKHTLFLVSMGMEEEQYQKIIRAGINPEWFHTIIITHHYNKIIHYRGIFKSIQNDSLIEILPSQIIVCGDKFKTDLLPAMQLGMWTIQIEWGRGKQSLTENAHYCISDLHHLTNIITTIQCKL